VDINEVNIEGARQRPAGLASHDHALAPVSRLPVRGVLGAAHILTDLTPRLGEVVHDDLAE